MNWLKDFAVGTLVTICLACTVVGVLVGIFFLTRHNPLIGFVVLALLASCLAGFGHAMDKRSKRKARP